MKPNKVIWTEGMFLRPHHFQQLERYFENSLHFLNFSSSRFGWGASHVEIDKDGIQNGIFSLRTFNGLLYEGLSLNIPDIDDAPKSREFKEHFDPSKDVLGVYLSVPDEKPGTSAFSNDSDNSKSFKPRYRGKNLTVFDISTGEDEQQISVAVKRTEILFSNENRDDSTCIKVAEVIRTQKGTYNLREDYIPPSLSVSSCEAVKGIIARIFEKLNAKSNSISSKKKYFSQDSSSLSGSELTAFLLSMVINSYIPVLNHFHLTGKGHPEELFLSLAKLAGELTAFSPTESPKNLPQYNHENLSLTFCSMEEKIDQLLEIGISSKIVSMPLSKVKERVYSTRITDDNVLQGRLYLAVGAANLPADEIIGKIPSMAKISSLDNIDLVISAQMPGLPVSHTSVFPAQVSVKAGYQYFLLENNGKDWEQIKESRTIAIYLPVAFKEASLEIIAVKE